MNVKGTVIKVDGDTALVATERTSGCGSCSGESACSCDDPFYVTARNLIGAAKGDQVELHIGSARMWGLVFAVFWSPIIFGAVFYFAAEALVSEEFGIGAAVVGVIASLAFVLWLERRAKSGRTRFYEVIRIL